MRKKKYRVMHNLCDLSCATEMLASALYEEHGADDEAQEEAGDDPDGPRQEVFHPHLQHRGSGALGFNHQPESKY
jgi:hypothetical protein